MGYVAISRAREQAVIFTNSADQLREAPDRNVDKAMAIEAVRQSSDRDALSREEWERLVRPTNREASAEQSLDQGLMRTTREERDADGRSAGEEIELELNS